MTNKNNSRSDYDVYDDAPSASNALKVKLHEPRQYGGGSSNLRGRTIVFHVTPDVAESRSVNYKATDPIHAPGQIYVYTNTSSRAFNLTGIKLISRTREEATKNLARLNLLRSWMMPVFGQSGGNGTVISNNDTRQDWDVRGAPPPVLELSAYSDHNRQGNLYRIPVVITQMGLQYPSDVDYIPSGSVTSRSGKKYDHIAENTPVATIMNIDITLAETHSPREYSNFSLRDYRLGQLEGF